ncbi:MAG: agmatine deiminase family protein [Puniceicoccales bacterium]|jgi:agmatine deiminase|nr:agmatine deiminase family protein [Puniceicoccales bacterium]
MQNAPKFERAAGGGVADADTAGGGAVQYAMPPEWATQSAVWLSWPSNTELWPGHFDEIGPKFAEFAAAISRFEPVRINCAGALQPLALRQLNAAGADLSVITLHDHATNDVWCRDHGPLFVKNTATGALAVSDWEFRGWGGKFEAALDNAVPRRVADALGLPRIAAGFELEGGAIEVNGTGQLLTTEAVLNNPNRATGRDDAAFRAALANILGAREILWLAGGLANDDTDGHIDNIARFFAPDGIVAATAPDPRSPNHRALAENLERLRGFKTAGGTTGNAAAGGAFNIVELPLPAPFTLAGRDLPPSYANFLIVNGGVIVPIYGQRAGDLGTDGTAAPGDDAALGILREIFPGRAVVGIDCRVLLIEGGALHCLSQQQPA